MILHLFDLFDNDNQQPLILDCSPTPHKTATLCFSFLLKNFLIFGFSHLQFIGDFNIIYFIEIIDIDHFW